MKQKNKTKWEISVIELQNEAENKFKVTRRQPEFYIAETKIFQIKKEAKKSEGMARASALV